MAGADVILTGSGTGAPAQISFQQPDGSFPNASYVTESSGTTSSTRASVAMDLNQDGYLDLVGIYTSTHALRHCLNDGTGAFDCTTNSTGLTHSDGELAVGDFTGDGVDDIFYVNSGDVGYCEYDAASNDFSCTSLQHTPTAASNFWYQIGAADLDGDGDLDFLLSNTRYRDTNGTIDVCLNDGNLGVSCTTHAGFAGNMDVSPADFDGDGDIDAIVQSWNSHPIYCENDGAGGMTCAEDTALGLGADWHHSGVDSSLGWRSDAADVDGDGDVDLALSYHGVANLNDGFEGVYICLNDGGAAFTCSREADDYVLSDVDFGDLDCDGAVDFATGSANGMEICSGDGAGGFTCTGDLGGGQQYGAIVIGDFDEAYVECAVVVDTDGDGVDDDEDSCLDEDATGYDLDADGCLDDSDGDGVTDDIDAFPTDPDEDSDADGDGVGDNADAFPDDPAEDSDGDGDGVGDNADACAGDDATGDGDSDGVCDDADACDGDDASGDTDGDVVCDDTDAFPDDSSEWLDSDGDGVGDNGDLFPTDPNETGDGDGDGVGDNGDPCTGYPNADADADGVCDDSDVCPTDPDDIDDDSDGVCDVVDVCVGADNVDADGDQVCDDLDMCEGNDASGDDDEDGLCSSDDNCPGDANADQADDDGDDIGDVCEADTDTDGVIDDDDNCVDDANDDQSDLDEDGAGDVCDDDDDGDGVADDVDNCPFYDNADQDDYDLDGLGDVCDGDDDADGVSDDADSCPGTPLDALFDTMGCSGAQRVELICGVPADYGWRRRYRYVRCTVREANSAYRSGLLTWRERARTIRRAVRDVWSRYIRRLRRWC